MSELSIKEKFLRWRNQYFPERQVFLRSDGKVKFITLSGNSQLALITGVTVVTAWLATTSFTYLTRDLLMDSKDEQIATLNQENAALNADFDALNDTIATRADILEERQKYLDSIEDASREVAEQPEVPTEDEDRGPMLGDELMFIERMMGTSISYASAELGRTEKLLETNARLKAIEAKQRERAESLISKQENSLMAIDTTLEGTPLNTTDLAAKADTSGLGGPLTPVKVFEPVFSTEDATVFEKLHKTTERLDLATSALNSFPTGKPAGDYYISSRFGIRTDPFTKKRAHHGGLDLAGWPGTDIYSTSGGTVTKAGTWGAYGRMIEVDHGNGLRTRYGHMKKLHVKRGDIVTEGQKIGTMGKSGRATSSHLHFEVLYEGKSIDPLPFLKAADDVRKIQGRDEKE